MPCVIDEIRNIYIKLVMGDYNANVVTGEGCHPAYDLMAQQTTLTTTASNSCRAATPVVSALAAHFVKHKRIHRRKWISTNGITSNEIYASTIDGALPRNMCGPTEAQTLGQTTK